MRDGSLLVLGPGAPICRGRGLIGQTGENTGCIEELVTIGDKHFKQAREKMLEVIPASPCVDGVHGVLLQVSTG